MTTRDRSTGVRNACPAKPVDLGYRVRQSAAVSYTITLATAKVARPDWA
jgi:hypothetical protein